MADIMGSKISNVGVPGAGLLREVDSKSKNSKEAAKGISFADTLTAQVEKAGAKEVLAESSTKPILKFSNHALERMNTRGISFSPSQITKIEQGMQKASDKGAKETLVLTDDSALIVSLKNNTVVTVMDKTMLRENVFTNIDSTVFV